MVMGFASNNERDCIEIACQARQAAATARLAELKKNGVPFENPISDLAGGITWNESLVGKLKQIALLPLLLVYVLVAFAMVPIFYILNLWDVYLKKKELKREIKALEVESLSDEVPDEKDVKSLWRLHGFEERECSLDEKLNLLSDWIRTLYGRDVLMNLRLQSRVDKIAEIRVKVNLPYYRGEEGAGHFILAPTVDTLLRQLSEELPLYG